MEPSEQSPPEEELPPETGPPRIYSSIDPKIYAVFMGRCLDIKERETGARKLEMGDMKRFIQIALREWALRGEGGEP